MAREVQRRRSCVAEFLERRVLLAFSNVGASGTPDRASPAVAAVTAGAVDPPPTAVLVSAPAVSAYGGVYYYYQLSYADNVDVDYQSIVAGNDTQVSGPGGYSQLGTLANLAESAGIWTATYYVTAPGGAWDAADLGTYTIALRADEVKDLAGNFTPARTLGTFAATADPPPVATLVSAPDVKAFGGVYYYYQVRYADNVGVDYQTIVAGNDTAVTGPDGYSQLGTLANLAESGGVWTATYYVTAPGGTWDAADSGAYTIALRANEVGDTSGNFSAAGTLGSFNVGDGVAPTARLVSSPIVSAGNGDVYYYYVVNYADDVGVDCQSIVAGRDTLVTGPNGYAQTGTLANLTYLTESGGVWTATYYITAPGGAWDDADAGAYTIALRPGEVSDLAGNFAAPKTLGSFSVFAADRTPPTVTLTPPYNVVGPGDAGYYVFVHYDDVSGVDYHTIGDGDVLVIGPGGYSAAGTLVNLVRPGGWQATYFVAAPGGTWDAGDNGTYTISMAAGQVSDAHGNFVPAGTLGTFTVSIAPAGAQAASASRQRTLFSDVLVGIERRGPRRVLSLSEGPDVFGT
jgi:hypothetical protein